MKLWKTESILLKAMLLLATLFTFQLLNAQTWLENLPQAKAQNGTLTLKDYQQAFNSYWEPYDVKNGYYVQNGEKVKATGWKQFKRWEWYWEYRVDPQTGAFPTTSAAEEYQKYVLQNPEGSRSPSGNWTSMGPSWSNGGYAGIGRLNCVAFRPGDVNTIYAGAASGGIWKSTDGGNLWTPLGDNNAVLGVSDIIVINQGGSNPDALYIATGDKDGGSMWSLGGQQSNDNNSVGVLKSTDGGATWNTTGLTFSASQKITISRLILDPNSGGQIIYAATSNGIYKTTNGGSTWPLNYGTNIHFIDMEMNPSNSSTLYASTYSYWGTPQIYYTTNGGTNWYAATTPFVSTDKRVDLAVTAANSTYVYAVVANRSGGLSYVCRSTNTGTIFSTVYTGSSTTNLLSLYANESGGTGGQGGYDLAIAVSPTNANEVYVGGINTHKSTNGGTSWTCVSCWTTMSSYNNINPQAPVIHADQHFIAFQNSSTMYICNDGGLYKTTNGGSSWTDKTNTMVISQLYRLGVSQTVGGDVITGLQDNGTKVLATGPGWVDVIGGDGMECIIDHTNVNVQYGTVYYGDIYKTNNYWGSASQINPANGAWVTPYVMHPTNNLMLVAGYADVWTTWDGGNNWSKVSNNLVGGGTPIPYLRSVAVAPSNTNVIYAANLTNIWKTTNGGGSWIPITSGLPIGNSNITYITVKNNDPNTVWLSFGGYNSNGVYQTTNGGTTWTNISSGLPQLPVMCVIQNTQNTTQDELYVGTDVGVYVKVGSANWAPFSTGLPKVVVTELDIYYDATPSNSRIRAATFGRGLWESDLYSAVAPPVADFSADDVNPVVGQMVTFTDLSTNSPTSWSWVFTPGTVTYVGGTSSSSQNPQVTFDAPGSYTVTLTATNAGGSNTKTKTNYINATPPPPIADFTADNVNPMIGQTVNFTDLSTNGPTSWLWVFTPNTVTYVGGTSASSQNPQVQFNATGSYTVALTATNAGGSSTKTKTNYINVTPPPPIADFSADDVTPIIGQTVNFTDLSANSPTSWSWVFTPSTITYVGGTSSSSQNPQVQFNASGSYTVALTATNAGGSDTETKTNYITVSVSPPVADFVADNTSPSVGQTVNFTDLSTNSPTSWNWVFTPNTVTFIAGTSASSQNPQVQFNASGSYDVSLTATNAGGSDTETKTNYISVTALPPVADFSADNTTPNTTETVNFTDLSTNSPTSWSWSFSPTTITYIGGTSASSQNPQVMFDAAGSYTVSLTATNSGGSDTETKTDYINATDPPPVADFIADDVNPTVGQTVNFTDLSTNSPTSWSWVFTPNTVTYVGGTSASSQNPQVQFDASGSYTVALTATNAGGSDTETKTDYINVVVPAPVADFSADDQDPFTGQTVNFTDLSTNSPTSWSWTFTPNTVTFVGGTSASSQNPQVQFNATGDYDVSLTATNAGGSDTEVKTNYISVSVPPPDADFSADNLNPTTDDVVNFTDLSTNSPTSWSWTFTPSTITYMNGTNANSQDPQVQFNSTGSYTVSLTATNGSGSDTETKTNYINVTIPPPVADFTADNTTPETTETVTFTDLSTNSPTSWAWVFTPNTVTYMNGTNANSENPQVRFDAEGLYDVQLTATNAVGSDVELKVDYINCTNAPPPPDADFTADNTNPTTEETVNFTDLSTNSPTSWSWTFTPSTITYMNGTNANSQNPKVKFNSPGSYTVSLTATNAVGSDTETKTDYINATDPAPAADFTADNLTPLTTETVNFTDLSSNNPTSWSWVFTPSTITYMDGTNSNSQNPKVRFDNPGAYTVELTATNAGGSDTETKTDYINASNPQPPPVADFTADNLNPTIEETVNFTDLSTNTPTSWSWVFTPSTVTYMDGTNANSQHPKVKFDSPGVYTVELTATNAGGSDTEIKTDYINATNLPPEADFVADNLNPTIEETVSFTDLSTNTPISWSWVFTPSTITYMEGTGAGSQNPKVRFDDPGAYTVELTATNAGGSDTEIKTDYINATVVPPEADFVADNTTPDVGETVTFTDLSTNNPTSWLWSFTPSTVTYVSGTNQNSQNPQVQFDVAGLYTVELTASNAGGSNTETKPGYINAGDVFEVVATATPDEICAGDFSQLHSFPSGGSGNYTFLWSSDPPGFFSNLQNPVTYPEETTTYTVEVNDGSESVYDDVTVTVHPLPIIELIDWPELLCHFEEPPVQLVANPPGGIFSGAGVTMDGLFDPEIAPLGWDVITYTYEDVYGCENSAQDSIYVDNCVGVFTYTSDNIHLDLYPNPTTGKFTLRSNLNILRVDINNQMGKLVSSEEYNSTEVYLHKILPRGIYFVRVALSGKKGTKYVYRKLMIQ